VVGRITRKRADVSLQQLNYPANMQQSQRHVSTCVCKSTCKQLALKTKNITDYPNSQVHRNGIHFVKITISCSMQLTTVIEECAAELRKRTPTAEDETLVSTALT
jgi:hypothetical protein